MQRNEEKQNDTAKREKVKYKGKESNGRQKEEKREDKEEHEKTIKQKMR